MMLGGPPRHSRAYGGFLTGPQRTPVERAVIGQMRGEALEHQPGEPARHERHEYAREDDVAEEMRPRADADQPGKPSRRDGRDKQFPAAPRFGQQRNGEAQNENAGCLAADEGAVSGALIGAQQGWRELFRAAELRHMHRPGAAPMILEAEIGDQPRPDQSAECDEAPRPRGRAPSICG